MRRGLTVAATLVGGLAFAAVAGLLFGSQQACQLQGACDPSNAPPTGQPAPKGDLIDENNWESGPLDGTWVPFPGQRTQAFDLTPLGFHRPIANVAVYLSPDPNFIEAGSNFTTGAGNLAEILAIYPTYEGPPVAGGIQPGDPTNVIVVTNSTCAPYYLRLTVQAFPLDGGAPPVTTTLDASDASSSDGADVAPGIVTTP